MSSATVQAKFRPWYSLQPGGSRWPLSGYCDFDAPVGDGHLIYVQAGFLGGDPGSPVIPANLACADDKGNTYHYLGYAYPDFSPADHKTETYGRAAGSGVNGDASIAVWYAYNVSGGPTRVTVSGFPDGNVTDPVTGFAGAYQRGLGICILEKSGIKSSGDPLIIAQIGGLLASNADTGPPFTEYDFALTTSVPSCVVVSYGNVDGFKYKAFNTFLGWNSNLAGVGQDVSGVQDYDWYGTTGTDSHTIFSADDQAAGAMAFHFTQPFEDNTHARNAAVAAAFEEASGDLPPIIHRVRHRNLFHCAESGL